MHCSSKKWPELIMQQVIYFIFLVDERKELFSLAKRNILEVLDKLSQVACKQRVVIDSTCNSEMWRAEGGKKRSLLSARIVAEQAQLLQWCGLLCCVHKHCPCEIEAMWYCRFGLCGKVGSRWWRKAGGSVVVWWIVRAGDSTSYSTMWSKIPRC